MVSLAQAAWLSCKIWQIHDIRIMVTLDTGTVQGTQQFNHRFGLWPQCCRITQKDHLINARCAECRQAPLATPLHCHEYQKSTQPAYVRSLSQEIVEKTLVLFFDRHHLYRSKLL